MPNKLEVFGSKKPKDHIQNSQSWLWSPRPEGGELVLVIKTHYLGTIEIQLLIFLMIHVSSKMLTTYHITTVKSRFEPVSLAGVW